MQGPYAPGQLRGSRGPLQAFVTSNLARIAKVTGTVTRQVLDITSFLRVVTVVTVLFPDELAAAHQWAPPI